MRAGKKGISDIVAVMLMILIVFAGTTIFYVYSMGLFGSLQGAQPQQPYVNQIALEYYDWTATTTPPWHTLRLILRNVGTGRGTIADFFVGNSTSSTLVSLTAGNCTTATNTITVTVTAATSTSIVTRRPLFPNMFCTATLTIPDTVMITGGAAYELKIVTKDGSVFRYSCIAGRSSGSIS